MVNRYWFGVLLGMIGLLMGCTLVGTDEGTESLPVLPTPTTHPFLQQRETVSTPSKPIRPNETMPTALPEEGAPEDSTVTPVPLPTISPLNVITKTVYGDALDANWQLRNIQGIESDFLEMDVVHNGRFSIAMRPVEDFRPFYFIVNEDATEVYPASQVLGLNFWLHGGNDYIELSDFAITVVGSNDYPYWVQGDTSVYTDGVFPFSETALYWLDFNNAIPPNTWVEVTLWLDEREFDPVYEYVTGFYLKNDEGFYNEVYIDDISLIMLGDEAFEALNTSNEIEATQGAVSVDEIEAITPTDILTETASPSD